MSSMSLKSYRNLAELVSKYEPHTHYLRLQISRKMYHAYCQILEPYEAFDLTCELLRVSRLGLKMYIDHDHHKKTDTILRNNAILDMRASGMSYSAIQRQTKLSRAQIWRILTEYSFKVSRIKKEGIKNPL